MRICTILTMKLNEVDIDKPKYGNKVFNVDLQNCIWLRYEVFNAQVPNLFPIFHFLKPATEQL